MNWIPAQQRLHVPADGTPGPQTYAHLLATVAGRAIDATILAMATALAQHATAYGMTTPARLCEFVAQICNETGGFRRFTENLYYSTANQLQQTWPARFPRAAVAQPYVGHPEALANLVYGGRGGNTEPGDGWKYRGRGALQLTFRDNYRAFGAALGLDLEGNPELAADPAVSVLIALRFFQVGRVNVAVDAGDFARARRITNGGAIGLEHVAQLRAQLLTLFA